MHGWSLFGNTFATLEERCLFLLEHVHRLMDDVELSVVGRGLFRWMRINCYSRGNVEDVCYYSVAL